MSARKRSKATTGKKIGNVIAAALLRFAQGRAPRGRFVPVALGYAKSNPLHRLSPYWCDEALICEVGLIITSALIVGDRRIIKTLKDAFKMADHIFKRDRERVLLGAAMIYRLGEGRDLDEQSFFARLEKRANHGKPFHKWQRQRLRRATGFSAPARGRPRKKVARN